MWQNHTLHLLNFFVEFETTCGRFRQNSVITFLTHHNILQSLQSKWNVYNERELFNTKSSSSQLLLIQTYFKNMLLIARYLTSYTLIFFTSYNVFFFFHTHHSLHLELRQYTSWTARFKSSQIIKYLNWPHKGYTYNKLWHNSSLQRLLTTSNINALRQRRFTFSYQYR